MEYFLKSIQKYNTNELRQLYYLYRNKRKNGDHTYRTLSKIQILNRILLKKGVL